MISRRYTCLSRHNGQDSRWTLYSYHLFPPWHRQQTSAMRALAVAKIMLRNDQHTHLPQIRAFSSRTNLRTTAVQLYATFPISHDLRRVSMHVCRVFAPGPDRCRNHETREYEHEEDRCFHFFHRLVLTCHGRLLRGKQGLRSGY